MQINATSPIWPSAINTNPYEAAPIDDTSLKNRHVHECFEAIVSEVLKAIAKQEQSASLTWNKVLQAEQCLRDKLLEEQRASQKDTSSWQTANGIFKKLAGFILPACIVIQGAAAIASGGTSIPLLAAVTIAFLLILDDLLDDPGKRAIASLLAKTNDEDTETWLKRVCLVSTILMCAASIAIGAYQNTSTALHVVTTASGVVLSSAQAGTEVGVNFKKAHLATLDCSWEESTRRFSELLSDTKKQIQTANFMFQKNMELQQSVLQTAEQILSR